MTWDVSMRRSGRPEDYRKTVEADRSPPKLTDSLRARTSGKWPIGDMTMDQQVVVRVAQKLEGYRTPLHWDQSH